jgi:hypothetical protein
MRTVHGIMQYNVIFAVSVQREESEAAILYTSNQEYFCDGTPSQKFFFRMQAGMAFWNLFFLALA